MLPRVSSSYSSAHQCSLLNTLSWSTQEKARQIHLTMKSIFPASGHRAYQVTQDEGRLPFRKNRYFAQTGTSLRPFTVTQSCRKLWQTSLQGHLASEFGWQNHWLLSCLTVGWCLSEPGSAMTLRNDCSSEEPGKRQKTPFFLSWMSVCSQDSILECLGAYHGWLCPSASPALLSPPCLPLLSSPGQMSEQRELESVSQGSVTTG